MKFDHHKKLLLPVYTSRVKAGFPSPADDYKEDSLDLNQFLVPNPDSTYFVRVEGESMIDAHIQSGDLLIVDKSLSVRHNDIVVASINNDFTVKRFVIDNEKIFLAAENKDFPAIELKGDIELIIWGVVTSVIHQFKHR